MRRHSTYKFFVECPLKHSTKIIFKNKKIFAECRLRNTRQSFFRKIKFYLSSVRSRAFGKVALDNLNGRLLSYPSNPHATAGSPIAAGARARAPAIPTARPTIPTVAGQSRPQSGHPRLPQPTLLPPSPR